MHPNGLSFKVKDMITLACFEFNFWLGFLVLHLEDLFPPIRAACLFNCASQIAILLNDLFLLHVSVDPTEGVIVHFYVDGAVKLLLNFVHEELLP